MKPGGLTKLPEGRGGEETTLCSLRGSLGRGLLLKEDQAAPRKKAEAIFKKIILQSCI